MADKSSPASRHQRNVTRLRPLAKHIETKLADGTLFALVIFDQDLVGKPIVYKAGDVPEISAGGYSSYISNADRHGIVRALRECAEKLERALDVPGALKGLN